MIYHNQAKYYEALQQSHRNGVDCQPFIDFLLDVIVDAMCQYTDDTSDINGGINSGLFGVIFDYVDFQFNYTASLVTAKL
jgi:hypothetical protein